MFCTVCGHQLSDSERFCSQCGTGVHRQGEQPIAPPSAPKRLVRPAQQKSIAGVCAGFANYINVDLTLMRIVWLCTAIFTGVGFIAYLVCWIVMPLDYGDVPAPQPQPRPQAPYQQTAAAPPVSEPPVNTDSQTGSSPA